MERIDRGALAEALEELKALPFPCHPDDPDLAAWVLELAELDGHLAGLASSALASARARPVNSAGASKHRQWLLQIGAVGRDEQIYDLCLQRITKLEQIENLLAGRAGRDAKG